MNNAATSEAPILTDATQLLVSHLAVWKHDRDLLARFFNTFSFLEHVGSRKILSSRIPFTEEHLRHAAEETRHALRFKRIAKTLASAPDSYDDYSAASMLGGSAAHWYFQRVDASVRDVVRGSSEEPMLSYLLVTYLVEKRAALLYPALQNFIEKAALPISLKGIIAEEDRHLEEIEAALGKQGEVGSTELHGLLALEDRFFTIFTERVMEDAQGFIFQN